MRSPKNHPHAARPRFSLAWFAGADLRILDKAPSEKAFYNALGTYVVAWCCLSGAAVCVALGYIAKRPPEELWPIGVVWALIIVAVERLVLQMPTARKRWLPLIVAPRLALGVLLAFQVGEPMVQWINQPEISRRLSDDAVAARQRIRTDAADEFDPQIRSAQATIARIRGLDARLRNREAHYTSLSEREAERSVRSPAPAPACNARCRRYERFARLARAKRLARTQRAQGRIDGLRTRIRRLRQAKTEKVTDGLTAVNSGDGWQARAKVLDALERENTAVARHTWYLRLLFLALDLVALGARVLRIVSIDSPYEQHATAERAAESLEAKRKRATVDVEEDRITDQTRADRRANKFRIDFDASMRMNADQGAPVADGFDEHLDGEPVRGMSFDEFVKNMEPHETRAVPVPPGLRRGGIVGSSLILGVALVTGWWSAMSAEWLNGIEIVLLLAVVVISIAVYTRGFTKAPHWALGAIFCTLVGGLALPLVVVGLNL